MARITVEDCLEKIDNRFDLVLVAARRAHMLKNGASELLPWDNDKPAVLALREIAAGKVTPDILDQPLQAPDEEIDPDEVYREAAEMDVPEVSLAHDDDEDDDEDYDIGEEESVDFSTSSAPADDQVGEGAKPPDAPDSSEEAARGA